MSTETKNVMEEINRSIEAIRTKSEDSVSKAELNNVVTQIEALQTAMASANSVSAADVAADALAGEKAAVGALFTKGEAAVEAIRDGKAFIKADGDSAAITVNPQGGYLLPKVFGEMVDGINRKNSPLRNMAKVIQGGLGFVTPLKTSKGTAGMRGEFDALTYSAAPKYDTLQHTFQEINSTEAVTVWADLNNNAIVDFVQSVIQDVTEAMAEQESDYFMRGTTQHAKASGGTIKNGLLSQTKLVVGVDQFTNTVGSLAGVETADALSVTADDVLNLLFSLHGRYEANTSILTSREVLKQIITKKDANGRYLLEVGNVQDGFAARVLGKGITIGDFFPTIAGAGNTPIMVAGDFRQGVTIVDASPVRWLVDPYTDKRMLQYTGRRMLSSAVVNYNALRALYVKAGS